jgi:hypothetical protein
MSPSFEWQMPLSSGKKKKKKKKKTMVKDQRQRSRVFGGRVVFFGVDRRYVLSMDRSWLMGLN